MENQEIIDSICYLLIDKKMYVDMNTISTVCSYLDRETLLNIQEDLEEVE